MMRITRNRIVAGLLHVAAVAVLTSSVEAADTFKSGTWNVSSLTIEAGDRLFAYGDLKIVATGMVEIKGQIKARRGVSIEIVASIIKVSGGISTADGADSRSVNVAGQDAGNITLDAIVLEIAGATIQAGNGGTGGWSANGGTGGSIYFIGCPEILMDERTTLDAGGGGSGGSGIDGYTDAEMAGGDGGESGEVFLDCFTPIEPEYPSDCCGNACCNDSNGTAGSKEATKPARTVHQAWSERMATFVDFLRRML